MFGSEDIMRIFNTLKQNFNDFPGRRILSKNGTPTVISFLIETALLNEQNLQEMFESLLEYDLDSICETGIWESFIHDRSIPVENIVKIDKEIVVENKYGIPV